MPWPVIWVCALSLALLGCSEVHRRDGWADRAAHRDALENIPTRCTSQERERYCEGKPANDPECIEHCGDPE
ncbi:hypothetical protein [Myxococcus landrumensis]|uniref:Lipoprotein n=1 Tax=Myxococcus landrumensis TaxID=2813577 RepID=A0ABX7N3K1_9BACT|nr:hypothetical protein [Myxococcus landrumus]QSQ10988.1 hypothetical protein JY572_21440 [Myxococcus landrumus]